jgi:hypothetical protein
MKQSEISIEVEDITPAIAATYLQKNRANRKLIDGRVALYTTQMLAGDWKLTGDSIKFDGSSLIDGQHRLQGVIRSGVTIRCVVVRNLARDTFDVLDTGRNRQAGDVLSGYGYANVNLLASAARFLYHYERRIVPSQPTLPNSAILEVCQRHNDLSAFCSDTTNHKFARAGVIIACLYWIDKCGKLKGQTFTESFLSGTELKLNSPIYALRERMIADRSLLNFKQGRVAITAMFFRAFDHYLTGKPATKIFATTPSAADFPWPKGDSYLEK